MAKRKKLISVIAAAVFAAATAVAGYYGIELPTQPCPEEVPQ